MSFEITYNYCETGTPLVDRLKLHVDCGESFVLLGYQGCGKRHALHMLGKDLEREGRSHGAIVFRDGELIAGNAELLEKLKCRLSGPGKDQWGATLDAATSVEDWFSRLERLALNGPLPISFANIEWLAEAIQMEFLAHIRNATEKRWLITGITGEGILARRLAHETSPFRCVHQYVIRGHDRDLSRRFFEKRVHACGLLFVDSKDTSWNIETAFEMFYERTGGNLNILRALLWWLSERRLRYDRDPQDFPCDRSVVKKSFASYTAIPLFGLRLFESAVDLILTDSETLSLVENLLDQVESNQQLGKNLEMSCREVSLPVTHDSPPCYLELAGFLCRDLKTSTIRFPSYYVAEYAVCKFSRQRRGDCHAKQANWEIAFENYKKVENTVMLRRPLGQPDYFVMRRIINRFCRELAETTAKPGSLKRLAWLITNCATYLFGLRVCRIAFRGDDDKWSSAQHFTNLKDSSSMWIDSLLSESVFRPARAEHTPAADIRIDATGRRLIATTKTDQSDPAPKHALLIETHEDDAGIVQGSPRHRLLETFASLSLISYNEARMWKRATRSSLRMGEAINKIFSARNLGESIQLLGDYLHKEFQASGVRLYLIDSETRIIRSKKSWGFKDSVKQRNFDMGLIEFSPDNHSELCLAITQNRAIAFRWIPHGYAMHTVASDLEFRSVSDNTFALEMERTEGDYWIDIPLRFDGIPFGKLTLAFPKDYPPTNRYLDDLETISAIFDQHLMRLEIEEAQLARARAVQQRAVSVTSHNLATRIASLPIILAQYQLLAQSCSGSTRERLLTITSRFRERLDDAMKMLKTAKFRLREVVPNRVSVDLHIELCDALRSIEPGSDSARLAPTHPLYAGQFVIMADKLHIRAVFDELISDSMSMQFPNRTLAVLVTLSEQADNVVIDYTDNGPGVPSEFKERIFEYNFSHRPGSVSPSLGMGLGYVKEVVTAHNGTINEIGAYGHGVHFRIVLPNGSL